jgi:hypothetical protein
LPNTFGASWSVTGAGRKARPTATRRRRGGQFHATTPRFPFPARGRGRKGRGRTQPFSPQATPLETRLPHFPPHSCMGGNSSKHPRRWPRSGLPSGNGSAGDMPARMLACRSPVAVPRQGWKGRRRRSPQATGAKRTPEQPARTPRERPEKYASAAPPGGDAVPEPLGYLEKEIRIIQEGGKKPPWMPLGSEEGHSGRKIGSTGGSAWKGHLRGRAGYASAGWFFRMPRT